MVRRVVGAGGVYDRGYRRVWCSKFRCPALTGPVGDRCGELVREKHAGHEWMVVAWEVTPGPVDLFVKVHLRHFPSCVADQFARLTSRVLREGFGHLRFRSPALWPRSYVAAVVESAGRVVVEVNPANTSRTCAVCGHCHAGNRRTPAAFVCVVCGHAAHADVNAAVNILRVGLARQAAEAA